MYIFFYFKYIILPHVDRLSVLIPSHCSVLLFFYLEVAKDWIKKRVDCRKVAETSSELSGASLGLQAKRLFDIVDAMVCL